MIDLDLNLSKTLFKLDTVIETSWKTYTNVQTMFQTACQAVMTKEQSITMRIMSYAMQNALCNHVCNKHKFWQNRGMELATCFKLSMDFNHDFSFWPFDLHDALHDVLYS